MFAFTVDESEPWAWLEKVLEQWNAWRHGSHDARGMGAVFLQYIRRDTPSAKVPANYDSMTAFERRMLDVDRAMAGLQKTQPFLFRAIEANLFAWPAERKAEHACCSVSTFYGRVRLGYLVLSQWLRP